MHKIKILAHSLTVLPSIKIQAGVTFIPLACAIAFRFIADGNTYIFQFPNNIAFTYHVAVPMSHSVNLAQSIITTNHRT